MGGVRLLGIGANIPNEPEPEVMEPEVDVPATIPIMRRKSAMPVESPNRPMADIQQLHPPMKGGIRNRNPINNDAISHGVHLLFIYIK